MATSDLPQDEQTILQSLHLLTVAPRSTAADTALARKRLHSRVRALREAGWPLRAVGEPIGAARSTVRFWEKSSQIADISDLPPVPEHVVERVIRTASPKKPPLPTIEPTSLRLLSRAQIHARRYRAGMHEDSLPAQSRVLLDEAIRGLCDRSVGRAYPVARIARLLNVTHRAVAQRLISAQRRDVLPTEWLLDEATDSLTLPPDAVTTLTTIVGGSE